LGGLTGLGTFFYGWWYAIAHWGWFLGLGLGWIPAAFISLIIGTLVTFLWGVAVLGVFMIIIFSYALMPHA